MAGDLLDFRAKVDFTQAKKDIADFEKMVANLKVTTEGVSVKTPSPASNGNWKQAQASMLDMLSKTRKELADLKLAYQELKNKQEEGKIAIQGITEATAKEKLTQAELKTQLDQGKISRQVYNEMLVESKVRQSEMDEAIKKQTLSDKEYTRQLREKAQAEKENKAALKAGHAEYQAAAGSYDEANRKAQALLKSIKSAPGAFESQSAAVRTQIADYIKLNDQLKAFDAGLGNHQREVGNYAKGFSGLSNSINQITRELPAFTFSAQTGFLALSNNIPILFDEISKVNRVLKETSIGSAQAAGDQAKATALAGGASEEAASQVSELAKAQALQAAEGKRGIGMLKAIGSALFSWGTLLSVGVTLLTVYGKEIGEWVGALFKGKEAVDELARSQKILQEALVKGGQDGQAEATNLKVLYRLTQETTVSVKKRKEAIDELQKQWPQSFKNLTDEAILSGKARIAYDNLTQSIIATAKARAYQDVMAENAKRRFANDELIAKAEIEYNKSTSAARLAQSKIEGESARFYAREAENAEKKQAEFAQAIREARKDNVLLADRDLKLQERITEQVVKGAKVTEYVAPTSGQAQLNAQISLQKRVDALLNESKRKQLTREQEEVQAVKDKFAAIILEVERFNDNPKNKAKVGRLGALKNEMGGQIEAIEYRAATDRLKDSLDEQRAIYESYETFKTDFGKQAADERYSNEINTSKRLADVMQDEYSKIMEAGSITGYTAAMTERMKFLEGEIKKEAAAEEQKYNDLVKEFMDYNDKRKLIVERYNQDIAILANNPKAKGERARIFKEDLNAIDDENVKKLDTFRDLYDGIERLSDASAKRVIERSKDLLNQLVKDSKISAELAKELALLINDSDLDLKDRLPGRLVDLANQIDLVASAVSGVNEEFAKVLSTLGSIIGQVGNIKKGFSDMKAAQGKGDILGQLAAGAGIFGAGMFIMKSAQELVSLFDKSEERAEKAANNEKIRERQNDALNKILERQIELLDDAYGTKRLDLYNEAVATVTKNQAEYNKQLQARYLLTGTDKDWLIEKVNRGEKLDNFQQGAFDKAVKKGQITGLGDISGLGMTELKALAAGGSIDEGTRNILNNIIASKQAVIDLENSFNAKNIGTSLDSLADAFIVGLTDQTEDFGDSFEKIIERSIMNGLKSRLIEKELQAYYELFAELSKDGLDKADIAKLDAEKDRIINEGKAAVAELEKATGIKLTVEPVVDNSKYRSVVESLISDLTNVTIENGVMKLGGSITDIINSAVLEGFQAQMVADGLKDFFEKLEEIRKGGIKPTKDQTDALKADYDAFIVTYNEGLTALELATGLSFRKITDLDAEEAEKRAEEAKRLAEQQAEDLLRLAEQQAAALKAGLESLADGLSGIFSSSEQASKDFFNNFDKLFNDKILSNFKETFLAEKLTDFYSDFAKMTANGAMPAQAQIEEMRLRYNAIVSAGDAELSRLQLLTGQKLLADQKIEPIEVPVEVKVDNSEFEALQDSILGVFAGLDGSIEDSTAKFETMMKKAVLNSFKTSYLASALRSFYDQLNGYTMNGAALTQVQIASLKEQYDAIIKGGKERLKEIEQATGISFEGELATGDGLKGKLQRELTETTASEFVGISRATFEQVKITAINTTQMLAVGRANLNAALAIQTNTKRTADNTAVLAEMAKDIKRMSGGRATPDRLDLGIAG